MLVSTSVCFGLITILSLFVVFLIVGAGMTISRRFYTRSWILYEIAFEVIVFVHCRCYLQPVIRRNAAGPVLTESRCCFYALRISGSGASLGERMATLRSSSGVAPRLGFDPQNTRVHRQRLPLRLWLLAKFALITQWTGKRGGCVCIYSASGRQSELLFVFDLIL